MNTTSYDAVFNPAASEEASALMWANLQAVSEAYTAAQRAELPVTEYDAWKIERNATPPAELAAEAARKVAAQKAAAKRIACERKVVRFAVRQLLAAGYSITVNNGEECPVRKSTREHSIMGAIQQCDEEWLNIWLTGDEGKDVRIGTIALVYGNSGPEVIADYSTSLETVLEPVMQYCEKLELAA